jgi:hypothetical protein
LSIINPTDRGLRGERPTTNRLNHGTLESTVVNDDDDDDDDDDDVDDVGGMRL